MLTLVIVLQLVDGSNCVRGRSCTLLKCRNGCVMRSFYATYNHIRLFVLGVPEAWQVALYDLHAKKWLDVGGCTEAALKDAKRQAVKEAAVILERTLPELKWH